jgi:large conductance mechanosensitive channel
MKLIEEFKTFAIKGNAFDLAVGVVIGAAFTSITNSLVNDVLNPFLGLLTGNIDFSDKAIVLREATETASAVSLNYGMFLNTILNFIIVAFALFLVVKQINKLRELTKDTDDCEPTPEPSEEVKLLTEIRDELKRRGS